MSTINYSDPLGDDVKFQEYLELKAQTLQPKATVRSRQSSHMGALVFVLMISLTGLGVTALLQYRYTQELVAQYETGEVAGVNESGAVQDIITAEGFSVVLTESIANRDTYSLKKTVQTSNFLTGVQSVTSSYTDAESKTDTGSKSVSGIEVEVIEYNNALDKAQFVDTVLQKLSNNYTKSEDIILPKDRSATHLKATTQTVETPDYYIAVTASNYYIIKVYNTEASMSLLKGLYLN